MYGVTLSFLLTALIAAVSCFESRIEYLVPRSLATAGRGKSNGKSSEGVAPLSWFFQ